MNEFSESKLIQFEFTIRYTPEQNSVAERMNRAILDKTRCMFLNCMLGKLFWSEAVQTAAYLINRSQKSSFDGGIPASLWFGDKPNLEKANLLDALRI